MHFSEAPLQHNTPAMTTTNPNHPVIQQARQERLEQAYLDSGRTCSTYTGLMSQPEEGESDSPEDAGS